jgi:hypothetical protein
MRIQLTRVRSAILSRRSRMVAPKAANLFESRPSQLTLLFSGGCPPAEELLYPFLG